MSNSFWRGIVTSAVLAFCMSQTTTAGAQIASPGAGAPTRDWTGLYIGGHAGYAQSGDTRMSYSDTLEHLQAFGPAFIKPVGINDSGSGALGGLQVGYNWQLAPQWIIGIEADWSWAGLQSGGSVGPLIEFDGTIADGSSANFRTDIRGLGSVRGRLGYAQPAWMAYFTGGLAVADLKFSGDIVCPTGICAGGGFSHAPVSFSDFRSGWVIGGGVEFKAASSPWILGLEYLHYEFEGTNSDSSALKLVSTGAPVLAGSCLAGERCVHYAFGGVAVDAIRARLTYKFN